MSSISSGFVERVTYPEDESKGYSGILINEVGSVHLSFTREEGAVLMVLWSGGHANVPVDGYPAAGVIPNLPPEGIFIEIE
jgi:hypothetical protein